eukprot:scaffold66102_cov48-Prasinocladus_malaysianus.AAC.1
MTTTKLQPLQRCPQQIGLFLVYPQLFDLVESPPFRREGPREAVVGDVSVLYAAQLLQLVSRRKYVEKMAVIMKQMVTLADTQESSVCLNDLWTMQTLRHQHHRLIIDFEHRVTGRHFLNRKLM